MAAVISSLVILCSYLKSFLCYFKNIYEYKFSLVVSLEEQKINLMEVQFISILMDCAFGSIPKSSLSNPTIQI